MKPGRSLLSLSQRLGLHAGGLAAVLLTIGSGYLLGIRPIQLRTVELDAEQQRLEMMNSAAESIDANIDTLRGQITATEAELQSLLARLPDRPHMDELMATVSDAARTAQAEVLSLQPTSTQTGKTAAIQTVRLRLRCDHASLCRFLAQLASGPGAVWVAAVEVQSEPLAGPGGDRGGIRRAELTLRVPHAAEKTLAGNLKRSLVPAPGA